MSVRRLNREIDAREFAEWQAYDNLEPIDLARRIELATAIGAQTTANAHLAPHAEPFDAADFMADWDRDWRVEAARSNDSAELARKIELAVDRLGLRWE